MQTQSYLDALALALDRETFRSALAYASRRCRLLRLTDPDLPKHLVADAISDTCLGDVSWDPDLCRLSTHLCGVIRSRTWKMCQRQRARPHVDLDTAGDLVSRAPRADETVLAHQVADAIFRTAAEPANDNAEVDVLAAFLVGEPTRRAVAERLELTEDQVYAALRRLARRVAVMPEGVQDALHECLSAGNGSAMLDRPASRPMA